jgi:hypothetical protein
MRAVMIIGFVYFLAAYVMVQFFRGSSMLGKGKRHG